MSLNAACRSWSWRPRLACGARSGPAVVSLAMRRDHIACRRRAGHDRCGDQLLRTDQTEQEKGFTMTMTTVNNGVNVQALLDAREVEGRAGSRAVHVARVL